MAYDKALQGQEDLGAALLRNVYQKNEGKEGAATVLARYVRRCAGAARHPGGGVLREKSLAMHGCPIC